MVYYLYKTNKEDFVMLLQITPDSAVNPRSIEYARKYTFDAPTGPGDETKPTTVVVLRVVGNSSEQETHIGHSDRVLYGSYAETAWKALFDLLGWFIFADNDGNSYLINSEALQSVDYASIGGRVDLLFMSGSILNFPAESRQVIRACLTGNTYDPNFSGPDTKELFQQLGSESVLLYHIGKMLNQDKMFL
jgi:hypothetical protein